MPREELEAVARLEAYYAIEDGEESDPPTDYSEADGEEGEDENEEGEGGVDGGHGGGGGRAGGGGEDAVNAAESLNAMKTGR